MYKLNELYNRRAIFVQYGTEMPAALEQEIKDEEAKLIDASIAGVVDCLPKEIKAPINSRVILMCEYRNGQLVKTSASQIDMWADYFDELFNWNDNKKEGLPSEDGSPDVVAESDYEEQVDNGPRITRDASIGFTVKFADGKTIKRNKAVDTMIEALRYIGFERAAKYTGDTFAGYPLVGKEKRTKDNRRWQQQVDGWWIYTNLANDRKKSCLLGIAELLNIPLQIIDDPIP